MGYGSSSPGRNGLREDFQALEICSKRPGHLGEVSGLHISCLEEKLDNFNKDDSVEMGPIYIETGLKRLERIPLSQSCLRYSADMLVPWAPLSPLIESLWYSYC